MITNLKIFSCLTSKGTKTLHVKVYTEKGEFSASIPSGTSKGKNECIELSLEKIKQIFPEVKKRLIGEEEDYQKTDSILKEIDGTERFEKIGGNLSLGISIAVARAQTEGNLWRLKALKKHRFPLPLSNIIGGGVHGGKTTWQEFLLLPVKVRNPYDAARNLIDVWKIVGEELGRKELLLGRNIENAWMCKIDEFKVLDFLSDIAKEWDMKLGVDIAASGFWTGKAYRYKSLNKTLTPEEHFNMISEIIEKYNLYYIEDPFHEEDFESFSELTRKFKNRLIVGDDIFCTNLKRLKKGIEIKSGTGAIIKPNQNGTLSDTENVVNLAKENRIVPVASHRSGETEDPWLSDLSLIWETPIIKIGVLNPDLPKQNRLFVLWEETPEQEMNKLPVFYSS